MKKLNSKEMADTVGSGCRWIKKLAQAAARGGDSAAALKYIEAWDDCKHS
jgi:hypothetical protein